MPTREVSRLRRLLAILATNLLPQQSADWPINQDRQRTWNSRSGSEFSRPGRTWRNLGLVAQPLVPPIAYQSNSPARRPLFTCRANPGHNLEGQSGATPQTMGI